MYNDDKASGKIYGKKEVIIKAKFNTPALEYKTNVKLDRMIENVEAMKVKHFAIIDDGSDSPIELNGSQLLLFSDLGSFVAEPPFYCGASVDQNSLSTLQYSDIIAWSISARASSTSYYPLGISTGGGTKLLFSSIKNIYNFSLGISNPSFNLAAPTKPYTIQAVIKFYTCKTY